MTGVHESTPDGEVVMSRLFIDHPPSRLCLAILTSDAKLECTGDTVL